MLVQSRRTWRCLAAMAALLLGASAAARAQDGLSVFAPNQSSSNVTVLRVAANGTLVNATTIAGLGAGPAGIAVHGDQARLYVTNNTGNTVSVVDTRANTVLQTIATGAGPRGVALTPNGRLLYVANNTAGANSVSVYTVSGVTGVLTALTTITTPANTQPRTVQFSPDSTKAFIVNQGTAGSPGFSVVDTGSHTITATIPTAGQMTAGAMSPDGSFMLASNADGIVPLLNTATNAVTTIATGSGSLGVAYSHPARSSMPR